MSPLTNFVLICSVLPFSITLNQWENMDGAAIDLGELKERRI
jgi:hypothetical protein